jgi:predicted RNase H-like nuclease
MTLAGVDGCPAGWICVRSRGRILDAFVAEDIGSLFARMEAPAIIAIDIPIGLTESGPRQCDLLARKFLGQPRSSSVFPAPVRSTLSARNHAEASALHERADGRRLSIQAFGILGKIREVTLALDAKPELQWILHEVHPEVSFALWNDSKPMLHGKKTREGRGQREQLIDAHWPGTRARLKAGLRGEVFSADDLNDAFAALWSAERIAAETAISLPAQPLLDATGIPMVIRA